MTFRGRIRETINDVFGLGLLTAIKSKLRHFGTGTIELNIRGVGPLTIRCRESDYETVRQCFRNREFAIGNEQIEARLFKKYQAIIDKGKTPVVIDAGANIGAASLWFRKAYPLAAIVAIEPDPGNIAILKHNVSVHKNITVVAAAIGSSPGHVTISNVGAAWAITTARAEEGCPLISIEQAVSIVPNGTLFFAKVDIEGFETDLFAENLNWLDDVSGIFLEPHDWMQPGRHTSRTFQKAIAAREFEIFIRGDNLLYVKLSNG